jgi:small subunit ribosomal protein S2
MSDEKPEEIETEDKKTEDISNEGVSNEETETQPTAGEVIVGPTESLLLSQDILLSAGIHIGTKIKTKDMEPFIYRVRGDGLFVLDLKKTDERIRTAAKFLARIDPSRIAVTAVRLYAREPVEKFCKVTRANLIVGRFIPGMFLNPLYPNRIDPDVILVSDPKADSQAVKEASSAGIPIVALCSTDNDFASVDYVIPTNNKGRRALAVVYWLLARQILRERGEIAPDADIPLSIDDFEVKLVEKDE